MRVAEQRLPASQGPGEASDTDQVDLLTGQGNGAVLRLPERQFPGALIQGDTLHSLVTLAQEAEAASGRNDRREALRVVRSLGDELRELRDAYEKALRKHGIPLPY